MSALAPGAKAPEINLRTTSGDMLSLSLALQSNPLVVLMFFKVSCPVCQFALPFVERIHRQYPQIPIWGVSQDNASETVDFARAYGGNFPMALDEHLGSTVDYDLTNVPTIFVIDNNRSIIQTISGFAKDDLEKLSATLAKTTNTEITPLFTPADDVPTLRPG